MTVLSFSVLGERRFIPAQVFGHPKATLAEVGGPLVLTLPFAPNEITKDSLGIEWVEIERPAFEPLLIERARKLPKLAFELILTTGGDGKGLLSAEPEIAVLEGMAERGLDLALSLGPTVSKNYWKLTELSFVTVRRENVTNHIAVARAQIVLTKSSPLLNAIVPGMSIVLDRLPPISPPAKRAETKSSSKSVPRTTQPNDAEYEEDVAATRAAQEAAINAAAAILGL